MTYTRLARNYLPRVAAALLAGSTLAHAQGLPGAVGGGGFSPPVKTHDEPAAPKLPPPPALPGAASNGQAAPAEKLATDLPPTEALFDAINRGDIGSARDALSRGADVSGTNVLGLTPLELSVDLARNDITFLLLSQRGSDSIKPPPVAGLKTANAKTGKARPGAKPLMQAGASSTTLLAGTARASALPKPPAPMLPASVRYAGSDPGTAIPQAGFLGFAGAVAQP